MKREAAGRARKRGVRSRRDFMSERFGDFYTR